MEVARRLKQCTDLALEGVGLKATPSADCIIITLIEVGGVCCTAWLIFI